MIEANNLEINVDELMQKIKEEVASRHGHCDPTNITSISNVGKGQMTNSINTIEALLKNAESRACMRRKWPDKLNRFPFNLNKKIQDFLLKIINFLFQDQREVNFNLIQCLKESVTLNRHLTEQIATLNQQLTEQILTLNQQLTEQILTLNQQLAEQTVTLNQQLAEQTVTLNQEVATELVSIKEQMDERLSNVHNSVQTMDDTFSTIDTWISSWMTNTEKNLDVVNNQIQAIDKRLNVIDELLLPKETQDFPKFFEVTEESYINLAIALSKIPIEEHYEHEKKDLFYYLLENVFYNSEIVKEKQKIYLNYINPNVSKSYPFLDAGCGRGEFIQNLTDSNIQSVGIDLNKLEIGTLRKSGFDVYESDIINYLEKSQGKYSGISALQVIEHLNIEYINNFLNLSFERLAVDGVIIIETVNPHSLYGLSNFYQDSTHVKPLPPELMKFLLEWHGFKSVKIIYSSLIPDSARIFEDKRMNYQDYAAIGYKKL